MADVEHIHIDCRRVMHHIRVMLTHKDVAGATHIRGELINFVKAAVDDQATKILAPQIADYKIISFSFRKFRKLQVNAAHPQPVALEPPDQMATDESAGPTDQRAFRHQVFFSIPKPAPQATMSEIGRSPVRATLEHLSTKSGGQGNRSR